RTGSRPPSAPSMNVRLVHGESDRSWARAREKGAVVAAPATRTPSGGEQGRRGRAQTLMVGALVTCRRGTGGNEPNGQRGHSSGGPRDSPGWSGAIATNRYRFGTDGGPRRIGTDSVLMGGER